MKNIQEASSQFSFVPFKREDHVYHNEAFAELCKDAVRAFNGTPVVEFMSVEPLDNHVVYAIYCIAKTGPYGTTWATGIGSKTTGNIN